MGVYVTCLSQIHCAGVVHSDIRRSNMRVFANSAQDALHIVLFDLSNAVHKYNRDGDLTYARDGGRFVVQLLQCICNAITDAVFCIASLT